ncbi:di-heme oxidoredictase family protein [Aliikangiella sp. G2MR2-5]|uniref:di-heme oxidoredictase family protein n=1 Tax=Aliikangiella sp. G2MR2-5 TaxID=2788943 RepID=UPI0018AB7CB9|nr:di-heme oxidoredictase family protein [Aliikangiella sp. G2MR2-5]
MRFKLEKIKNTLFFSFISLNITLPFLAMHINAAVVDEEELTSVAQTESPMMEHCDEAVSTGSFVEIFECGDELFEVRFNALDGVGMNVGDGGRFTRVPRADLTNWSTTTPARATGPNAEACNVCHTTETIGGAGDGAGPAGLNVIRDPLHSGSPSDFIQRNTPHLFGMAGLQLLAEEMSSDLKRLVDNTVDMACRNNAAVEQPLISKGIHFGSINVNPPCPDPQVEIRAHGIAQDLIIRPFQWKGSELSIRHFSRGAFHNELGMNPVELAGDNIDGDFDGITNEITIADNTAMTVYLAAQPRPTSLLELSQLRRELRRRHGAEGSRVADELGLPDLTFAQQQAIVNGQQIFKDIGCDGCHRSSLSVINTQYSEPSSHPAYREQIFPGGQPGLDPSQAIIFDITRDQPDNQVFVGNRLVKHLGAFEKNRMGHALIRLYGDLKLHDMGARLAENIDETGSGASVWMTKELWGLANTAPYLHDGRASTISEAIIEHGGEAEQSRRNFSDLANIDKENLLAFLNNLVLFFPSEEE